MQQIISIFGIKKQENNFHDLKNLGHTTNLKVRSVFFVPKN